MQEIILKVNFNFERLSKSLKKGYLYFCFRIQSLSIDKIIKNKKGPRTSDQSLFRLRDKFKKIPLIAIYYLTKSDDVIKSGFWVIPKITTANLCKPIHDIINYSTSICPFESGKCGKGKNTKMWISRKELFRWNKKKHFS